MIDLTIIIPSYNTKKLLRECLYSIYKSLEGSHLEFEVIVVDNNSKDGSPLMVKNEFPNVNLIENKKNLGYGRANNQAVGRASGKYILFLNSDALVLGNGIDKLYEFVENNVEVKIAGGKLFNPDMTPQASCGPFYSIFVVFGMLFLFGDRLGLTRYSPNKVKQVDWVSGACLFIDKKTFERVGGFDEAVFMYMEEIEFLYRARKMGYLAYFYPQARFIHYGAASSGKQKTPVINIFRGLLYFYRKHKMAWELFVLQLMLIAKSAIAYMIGVIFRNYYLKKTYKEAMFIVAKPKFSSRD